jgi:peptidyl-prolyl cis-trans isomerase A (cyclophilin A)
MNQVLIVRRVFLAAIASSVFMFPAGAGATIVEIRTVMGDFQVNLYDIGTPQTVANFLSYVNGGVIGDDYTDSVFHRSDPGFVLQGGGFFYDPGVPLSQINAMLPVINEPEFANVRGTISMARPGGNDFDTATNQWFINLSDNRAGLDGQSFAVFGEVIGNGMDVVDAIEALPTFVFENPFGEIPLTNYSATDFNNGVAVDDTHLIIINEIVVIDMTVDSAGAAGLNPLANTASNPPPPPPPSGGGGGGSLGLFGLLFLTLIMRRRKII